MFRKSCSNWVVVLLVSLMFGCAAKTSHIVVGKTREAIDPAKVVVYTDAPAGYEDVAVVTASDAGQYAQTDKQKLENAILALKVEAAKLGANGLVLSDVEDQYVDYQDKSKGYFKIAWGTAIYVPN